MAAALLSFLFIPLCAKKYIMRSQSSVGNRRNYWLCPDIAEINKCKLLGKFQWSLLHLASHLLIYINFKPAISCASCILAGTVTLLCIHQHYWYFWVKLAMWLWHASNDFIILLSSKCFLSANTVCPTELMITFLPSSLQSLLHCP